MDFDTSGPIREQLAPSEHLLWSGQPRQGVILRAADVLMIPFSLLWGGFAVFWEWSVITTNAPFFFKLWGIPFVLVGVYIVVGRFFWDSYLRANTYYGVTDQRVLIVTGGLRTTVKSLSLRTLSDISYSGSASESGSIQFGSSPWGAASWLGSSGWPGARAVPAFELASEAKRVYELIRQAQQKAA